MCDAVDDGVQRLELDALVLTDRRADGHDVDIGPAVRRHGVRDGQAPVVDLLRQLDVQPGFMEMRATGFDAVDDAGVALDAVHLDADIRHRHRQGEADIAQSDDAHI